MEAKNRLHAEGSGWPLKKTGDTINARKEDSEVVIEASDVFLASATPAMDDARVAA